jgi:hypothetical protein
MQSIFTWKQIIRVYGHMVLCADTASGQDCHGQDPVPFPSQVTVYQRLLWKQERDSHNTDDDMTPKFKTVVIMDGWSTSNGRTASERDKDSASEEGTDISM